MTDELVTIGSYEFVAEAEVAQMFLRENGVNTFLRDQSIIAMDWLLGNAIGYVKLQVPQSQFETARELLATLTEGSTSDGEGTSVRSRVCSSCGLVLDGVTEICPACSEADTESEQVSTDAKSEAGAEWEDDEERRGIMSQVRSLKKPIFWLVLLPILCGLALAAVAVLQSLLRAF
jgi:hypothetical protein